MAQPASTGAEQGGKDRGRLSLTSAADGRRPSVTRGSLVSGGSCLPTTELPSMSKGKALSSPDAALEQAAPQRSHRGKAEHQAVLQAISPLLFNRPFLEQRICGSWWAPPRGAAMPGVLSSLGGQYLDPGTRVATWFLFLKIGSESQRGPCLARLLLPPTLSSHFVSPLPPLPRLGLWDLQTDGA